MNHTNYEQHTSLILIALEFFLADLISDLKQGLKKTQVCGTDYPYTLKGDIIS